MRSGARPSKKIATDVAGDRPLCVVAQREARDAQIRRLLLHAAGVGQNSGRILDEAEELDVSQRLQHAHARRRERRGS